MRIAVIGAGVCGLTAARALRDGGAEVVVLEKARGVGGRLSTRRSDHGRFDHGAAVLRPGEEPVGDLGGAALEPFADGLVPVPAANALPKALADGLEVRAGVHVAPLAPRGAAGLELHDRDGRSVGTYDRVVVTAPAPQVAELLSGAAPVLAAHAAAVDHEPCWAAMAAFAEAVGGSRRWLRDEHGLSWAAAESEKPGRDAGERWVIQGDPTLSGRHLESAPQDVAGVLRDAWRASTGVDATPTFLAAHRWRYARVTRALEEPLLHDDRAGIVAGGDWCTPSRSAGGRPGTVRAAQSAGLALAAALAAGA